ncbi:hypothetical protein [Paenibacillus sp. R14(2021)]|uniref:hypothetical protein n=1 Tax=Paenibacillus sp. R14(2021) TaxID=2859228 RepID=UPI001C612887|nr:hypothetical protein [Paenibacillus sp. R14(2021)]
MHFNRTAQADLEKYLNMREEVYKLQKEEPALFLSLPNGKEYGSRMTKRAIQAMVIKYGVHFGMPNLTTRQLAHRCAERMPSSSVFVSASAAPLPFSLPYSVKVGMEPTVQYWFSLVC